MKLKTLTLTLTFGLVSTLAQAQTPTPTPAAPTAARVTFYRPARYYAQARGIGILCDSQMVTTLESKTYFTALLPVGSHTCQGAVGGDPFTFTVEAGGHYYVQVAAKAHMRGLTATVEATPAPAPKVLHKLACIGQECAQ